MNIYILLSIPFWIPTLISGWFVARDIINDDREEYKHGLWFVFSYTIAGILTLIGVNPR